MNIYSERIDRVRSLMKERGWDALVLTGSDPHCSEYPSSRWKQVLYLSGFSGEAGDLVITADHAGLWTDTRYFIQASMVLPQAGIALHKTRVPGQVLIPQWLSEEAFPEDKEEIVVAVDGRSQSALSVEEISAALRESGRREGEYLEEGEILLGEDGLLSSGGKCFRIVNAPDILDEIWEDRPHVPQSPVITLGADLTGEDRLQRISSLRKFLLRRGCDAILLTSLDEIAWLLCVRGSDIQYNPYVMSYLLVGMEDVKWFCRKGEIGPDDTESEDSFAELEGDGISIMAYDDVFMDVSLSLGDGSIDHLFLDKSTLNYDLFSSLCKVATAGQLVWGSSPVPLQKAVKNPTEIEGMRDAHIEDGIVMEKFLYRLETLVKSGNPVTEWDAACMLGSLRSQIPGYRGDSFETISAYGPSAALPHYVTPHEDAPFLEPHGLYLCDSGGQYLFGTTDITRTIPLGPCTEEEMTDYTLVLKGHIQLAMAVFPRGTAGCQLDVLARIALWRSGRNFGHGTGHGVGFFLGVHEGPQDIRQNFNPQPILPGMITSDEPGIYREGQWGVRHESLLLCVEGEKTQFGDFLRFEPLTLCHIDTSAILPDLLSDEELEWLNDYNSLVYDRLSPELDDDVRTWLLEKTSPLEKR